MEINQLRVEFTPTKEINQLRGEFTLTMEINPVRGEFTLTNRQMEDDSIKKIKVEIIFDGVW